MKREKRYIKTILLPHIILQTMKKTEGFNVGQDILEAGKTYTLTVKAESAYHFYSESVKTEFTVPEK